MGKVERGIKCNVSGCDQQAIRSISMDRVRESGLKITDARRGYLCKSHYKELKKKSKNSRRFERWRMRG